MTSSQNLSFVDSSCFIGAPQSGKTHAIAAHALRLAARGEDVLVLCATPQGKKALDAELAKQLGEHPSLCHEDCRPAIQADQDHHAGANGCMGTPGHLRAMLLRDLALELIAQPSAQALLGRKPRVLQPWEERFLAEDMRTSRIKGKRLNDVWNFLRGGWSNLADDEENWLVTLEEEAVCNLLRENLQFMGGMLACETGNLAVRALRALPALQSEFKTEHVLVDDYHLLDKASQILAQMLARHSFSLSAGRIAANPVFDEHPHFEGVREFLNEHPKTSVKHLDRAFRPDGIGNLLGRLESLENPGNACPAGSPSQVSQAARISHPSDDVRAQRSTHIEVRMGETMADELREIACACQHALHRGNDVLVVGTDGLWRANVRKNLARAGLPITPSNASAHIKIKDFRDERSSRNVRQACLERLAHDPHDGVAWRCLVGLGDHLARSAHLEDVRALALSQNIGIEEALEKLCMGTLGEKDENNPFFAPLAHTYQQARCDLETFMENRTGDKGNAGSIPSIRVCSPSEAAGLHAPLVVFGGFANGLFPMRSHLEREVTTKERRQRNRRADLCTLYGVAGCAQETLLITGFSTCSLEAAERLNLSIDRIKLKAGARIAQIEPSEMLTLVSDSEPIAHP